MALALRRVHIWLRGRSFVETPEVKVPPALLQRIDACWSVSMGLSMVDTIRGASFQARQLLLALDAGEPVRVTRALAAEAAFVATGGVRAEKQAKRLVAEARALAESLSDGSLVGLVDFCDGLTHFLVGRWRDAAQFTSQAERRFAEVGSMLSWEAANSRLFTVWSLFYLGDVAGLSVRIPALKLLLGDLPEQTPDLAKLASPVAHLDADDPPLFLLHGDADPQMPHAQSVEFAAAYEKTSLKVKFITLRGSKHGGDEFYDADRLDAVAGFLKSALTGASAP